MKVHKFMQDTASLAVNEKTRHKKTKVPKTAENVGEIKQKGKKKKTEEV